MSVITGRNQKKSFLIFVAFGIISVGYDHDVLTKLLRSGSKGVITSSNWDKKRMRQSDR